MTQLPEILHCGHPRPEPAYRGTAEGFGTGQFGVRQEEDGTETYHCLDCCYEYERQWIKTNDRLLAYLSSDRREITTWHGRRLMRVLWATEGKHNMGGTLYRIRARDEWGREWFGTALGGGMYCRLRLTKAGKGVTIAL